MLLISACYLERKDKIEDGNRILVQKFQSQLTQQLEILHKTVAVAVTQQEQQLKDMEEDMQSFVSTKARVRSTLELTCLCMHSYYLMVSVCNLIFWVYFLKATEELRERLGKLKQLYGSGIKTLDGIALDLEGNSQSTFCHLNSEVSNHSSAVEDVSIQ